MRNGTISVLLTGNSHYDGSLVVRFHIQGLPVSLPTLFLPTFVYLNRRLFCPGGHCGGTPLGSETLLRSLVEYYTAPNWVEFADPNCPCHLGLTARSHTNQPSVSSYIRDLGHMHTTRSVYCNFLFSRSSCNVMADRFLSQLNAPGYK